MRSRSIFDLRDTPAAFDTDFLPAPHDFGAGSSGGMPAQQIIPTDLPATTTDDGVAHDGAAAASSFALLDSSTDQGHQAVDLVDTSITDVVMGSGSINIIGTPISETSADTASGGLHIGPLVDGSFTGPAEALFGLTASTPTPFSLTNLTPMPVGGHGAEAAVPSGALEIAVTHPASQVSLDAGAPVESATGTANLAFLENSAVSSPITNSGAGSSGATASQVLAALDDSGLSVNGSGIKVGVLSDSFNDLGGAAADEADGALPSTVQVIKDLSSGGSDEGRAMMQIIHDIAPGANLAFYTAFDSEQDFANGILTLAADGAKVIVDDVGYYDEPFFQNGVVAQAIQTVEAEGVTYVTAAGNEASNGYQADFTAAAGTFDGQTLTNAESFGGSLTQTVTINTEGTGDDVPFILEWNQAYGTVTSSTADLKVLIFQNGSLVGTETNAADGEPTNPWVEVDFSKSGTYQIAIENMSSSSTDAGLIIKEMTWGDGLPATISGANSGTVIGHPLTPGAITTGAVYVGQTPAFGSNPAVSESFSSSGADAELLFANNGTALSSPESLSPVVVSGVDGINTTVPGGLSDFFGTSAASASMAGVAALILSANPTLSAAQVEQILVDSAAVMGNFAVAGEGLVQVNTAVALASEPIAILETNRTVEAIQGGSAIALTTVEPSIDDSKGTLTSATIQITNSSGSTIAGDKLFANGVESGTVNGLSVSWNATTDTLTLSGFVPTNAYALVLGEITYQDSGTDSSTGSHPVRDVTWTINDGTNSYSTTSTVETDRAPTLVNNTATDVTGATITTTAANGVMSNASDLDGDPLMLTGVSDASHGAGNLDIALAGTYGHLTLNPDGSYSYVADNTAAINNGATGSHLQDVFSYTVADNYGATTTATLTISIDRAPAVAASNVALTAGQTVAASSLFSATDSDGDAITTYAFENTGPGHFVLNGNVVEPNNQEIDLTAAQLSQLTYQSVQGSVDTLEVRVNDGTVWSNWTSFTVTPAVVIEAHGVTSLVEAGNNFYLDPVGGGTGPELNINGVAVVNGQLGGWTPIGAEQVSGGGYDVALKFGSADEYAVWSTNSSGTYVTNLIGIVSGTSTTLEAMEITFDQDLNGDGTIGIPQVLIHNDGTTKFMEVGNNYFLDPASGGTGPELSLEGAPFVAGQIGTWTPIGAVKVTGGYDIAWHDPSSGLYTVWSTDANGNYLSNLIGAVAGNSTALENYETTFNQDLNGDGTIGIPQILIHNDGTTKFVEVGNNYFLDPASGGTGPELSINGAPLAAGQIGTWTPIGAVKVAGGYDIAWHDPSSGLYTVWSTDANGNYLSNLIGAVAGNSTALENYETIFGQDLNGDGTIGIPQVLIHNDGTTKFVEVGNNYFLDSASGGTGPELSINGAPFVAGQIGTWTPIGAVKVTGGYDIAWHDPSSGLFTVWSTDANGNYLSNLIGAVAGNSTALENYETTFGWDINGDGTIGIPSTSQTASGGHAMAHLHAAVSSPPDNFLFSSASPGQAATSPGGNQNGATVTAGHDGFTFAPASNAAGGTHSAFLTDIAPSSSSVLADIHAALTTTHDEAFGNTLVPDAAHLWAHHGFHFL